MTRPIKNNDLGLTCLATPEHPLLQKKDTFISDISLWHILPLQRYTKAGQNTPRFQPQMCHEPHFHDNIYISSVNAGHLLWTGCLDSHSVSWLKTKMCSRSFRLVRCKVGRWGESQSMGIQDVLTMAMHKLHLETMLTILQIIAMINKKNTTLKAAFSISRRWSWSFEIPDIF